MLLHEPLLKHETGTHAMNTSGLVEFPQPFTGKLEERCGGFLDCALKRLEVDDEIQALLHSPYR